ncbi:hypothetical protein Tco_0550275 [Tanacetum coccineum]
MSPEKFSGGGWPEKMAVGRRLVEREREMVAVGEDEGDTAGAVVVTRWRWMRGGWCGGEDGDVAVVVMVAGAW